jgi:hypothetical protein
MESKYSPILTKTYRIVLVLIILSIFLLSLSMLGSGFKLMSKDLVADVYPGGLFYGAYDFHDVFKVSVDAGVAVMPFYQHNARSIAPRLPLLHHLKGSVAQTGLP